MYNNENKNENEDDIIQKLIKKKKAILRDTNELDDITRNEDFKIVENTVNNTKIRIDNKY